MEFKKAVKPLLDKYEQDTDKVFKQFYAELKAIAREKAKTGKKITLAENNQIFNTKYKPKIDKLEKLHGEKYKKLWLKFHK
jgi:hypothetical protein